MSAHPPGRSTARAHLRPVRGSDAAAVASLLGELGYPCTREDAVGRIALVLEDTRQRLLVADLHGELCGLLALDFLYYLPLGRLSCRITALVVAPAHRRFGVGRDLVREAEHMARREGAARIELTTAAHRHEAHAFYRSCGYEESSLRFVKRLGDA